MYAIPTVYGRVAEGPQLLAGGSQRPTDELFFGNAAISKKAMLQLSTVMDRGVVSNWATLRRLFDSIFAESMFVKPDQHAVLLTESALNPTANKEHLSRMFFNDFQVPALYFASGSVLALNAGGLTTGLVVDIGHSTTSVVPVYEGIIVSHACQRLPVAGYDITEQLARLVSASSGTNLQSSASHREIVRDMKERLAYVAESPAEERRKYTIAAALKHLQKQYALPDGTEVALTDERWRCCECLFDPSSLGMESQSGLPHLIKAAIEACSPDLQPRMLRTIVLAGGTSLLPGLRLRLEKELKMLFPDEPMIKIVEITKRHFSSWIGGSLLVSSPQFASLVTPRARFLVSGTV